MWNKLLTNLPRTINNHSAPIKRIHRCSSLTNCRLYSFESGRNRKSDENDEAESDKVQSSDSADKDPIQSSSSKSSSSSMPNPGRGRRPGHRSPPNHYSSRPELSLPFEPLSFDTLSHLNPKTLSVDMFFSLQRPLLEIELTSSERRSIKLESRLTAKLDDKSDVLGLEDQAEEALTHINTGSPSDPAFKPPLPSTVRLSTPENEFDEDLWPPRNVYQAYLITEPEGINPAWSADVKRYLVSAQQLVPPPTPVEAAEDKKARVPLASQDKDSLEIDEEATKMAEEDSRSELKRRRALAYLAPFGSSASSKERSRISRAVSSESKKKKDGTEIESQDSSSPRISQDPLSLTVQAARFLYSGMMAVRWPTASDWSTIEAKLAAAEQKYKSPNSKQTSNLEGSGALPSVRGKEKPSAGRRPRGTIHRMPIQLGGKGKTYIVTLSEDQMEQIVKYSEKILKHRIGLQNVPKGIMESLERLGEFLLRKHNSRSEDVELPLIKQTDIVTLDSVFRKKKRKMKVHKYKKRRRARRTLRKRQGRD